MKIYFAGPLFSEPDRDWILKVKGQLEQLAKSKGSQINVVWPFELISQSEIDRLGEKAKIEIFSRCKFHLDDADIVVALLDGAQVDDGTAWEIGYFYARKSAGQKIIGIRTDFRRAGESEGAIINAMIECSCDWLVKSSEDLLEIFSGILNDHNEERDRQRGI